VCRDGALATRLWTGDEVIKPHTHLWDSVFWPSYTYVSTKEAAVCT